MVSFSYIHRHALWIPEDTRDLVAATNDDIDISYSGGHGRGAWTNYDISIARGMSAAVLESELHPFPDQTVDLVRPETKENPSPVPFPGENPAFRALGTTWLRANLMRQLRLTVTEAAGIRPISTSRPGFIVGPLRWGLELIPESKAGRRHNPASPCNLAMPLAPPGVFTAKISCAFRDSRAWP